MKYLAAQEVWDLGIAQEVNRRLLHPRGLALQYIRSTEESGALLTLEINESFVQSFIELIDWAVEETTEETEGWRDSAERFKAIIAEAQRDAGSMIKVRDSRDDPEGIVFGDLDQEGVAKAERFEALINDRYDARVKALNFLIEPLPEVA